MKGFSFIEIIFVVLIILVMGAVLVSPFVSFQRATELNATTEQILSFLFEARSKTLASEGETIYGVHIETSRVVLFSGATFVDGTASNVVFTFPSGVQVSSLALNGGGSDVIFTRLTGETTQHGTITTRSVTDGRTRTITIQQTGNASS